MKYVLNCKELNIPYRGGMSSYVLILMLSAFMNVYSSLPTAGDYLLGALRYYSQLFNNNQLMIIQGEYIIINLSYIFYEELLVMDLYVPYHNAAASITRFNDIRLAFNEAYQELLISGIEFFTKQKCLAQFNKLAIVQILVKLNKRIINVTHTIIDEL